MITLTLGGRSGATLASRVTHRCSFASRLIRIALRLAWRARLSSAIHSPGAWAPPPAAPMPASTSASAATKLEIGGAALGRVKFGHFRQAEVAVHAVQPREQRAIAGGRRHRRIAASEKTRSASVRGRCWATIACIRRGRASCSGVSARRSPRAIAVAGDDVGLAGGGDAEAVGVDLRRRAAADHADIVGEVGLGQLARGRRRGSAPARRSRHSRAPRRTRRECAGAAMRGERPAGRAAPRDRAEIAAILGAPDFQIRARRRPSGPPRSGRGGRSRSASPGPPRRRSSPP